MSSCAQPKGTSAHGRESVWNSDQCRIDEEWGQSVQDGGDSARVRGRSVDRGKSENDRDSGQDRDKIVVRGNIQEDVHGWGRSALDRGNCALLRGKCVCADIDACDSDEV